MRNLPGGPVVKNPSCNAGDAGLIPGCGTKIPHAVGQRCLRAATHAPQLESPWTALKMSQMMQRKFWECLN